MRGVCPCCNGTGRVPVSDNMQKYKNMMSGYDRESDTFACKNCGGQYQFGKPTGEVKLNKDGVPCTHSYTGRNAGRCYTEYTCIHCEDRHSIDSGD